MWISNTNDYTELSRDELLSLLTYNQIAERSSLERFAQHKNIFAGAMITVLAGGGATLAAEPEELKSFSYPLIHCGSTTFCDQDT